MRAPVPLLVGTFREEAQVLAATRAAREQGLPIHDVYSPYPVHGIDEAMGLAPSRLTFVCFGLGLLGLAFAFKLQHWVSAVAWPLNVGGKPMNSFPAFIPVAFELTVLIAGLGTIAALFARCGLVPRVRPRFLLPGVTCDRFALAIGAPPRSDQSGFDADEARSLLARFGAEITVVEAP